MTETNLTITELLTLAKSENFDVYRGAVVLGSPERGYEVQHDYGSANVSYWSTHEEARQEAARLWIAGEASHIDDFIVKRASDEIADRLDRFDTLLAAEAVRIDAELRAS
ncbi:hypothetical protein [Rhizobium sp. BE258]|uniref:hypothetical protein n=1 Tax=Rhizobium sp. BE258 TaxID=2817722 RepID=UPI00285DE8AD|nr:hypothetical protein [Rhizobium sp. BE258]MDR7147165.1 hypothetical protein [Rhizobium sp. BE258]